MESSHKHQKSGSCYGDWAKTSSLRHDIKLKCSATTYWFVFVYFTHILTIQFMSVYNTILGIGTNDLSAHKIFQHHYCTDRWEAGDVSTWTRCERGKTLYHHLHIICFFFINHYAWPVLFLNKMCLNQHSVWTWKKMLFSFNDKHWVWRCEVSVRHQQHGDVYHKHYGITQNQSHHLFAV